MKITKEKKLQLVKEHLEEGVPLREIVKKYNYNISNVKYQCALYLKHGEKAFLDEEIKRYSREEKLKAIKKYSEGSSMRQVSVEMGLSDPSILRDWLRIYNKKGESGIKDTYSRNHYLLHEDRLNKITLDSMQDRMKYLEAENEYLKKLYSLIQDRSKQSRRK